MKSAEYWRDRFEALEDIANNSAKQSVDKIEKAYVEAQRTIQKEIEAWYGRFADNNQISLAEARKWLTRNQLEEFRWNVEKYIEVGSQANLSLEWLQKLENASAKFHVSRLESIEVGIQQQLELLYGNQVDELDTLLRRVAGGNYTHAAYEIQKGLGTGWDITALDQRKLDTIISKPWTTDGLTFRDRCWKDVQVDLADKLHKDLTQSLMRGDSPEKLIQSIQKDFGVGRYKARRLVHTETSYFNARANYESYKELGVEQVEILETLDSRTCDQCGPFDGMVVPISQYEPGVTIPPFHPNCRGTTVPYYDDMEGERAARNDVGQVYYLPDDITYSDWKGAFVEGGEKAGFTAIADSETQKNLDRYHVAEPVE